MIIQNKSFLFIRHRETDWNKNKIFQGQNDVPMNENGFNQVQKNAEENILKIQKVDHIFYSPLTRTVQTTDILSSLIPNVGKICVKEIMPCNSITTSKFILATKGIRDFPSFERIVDNGETKSDFLKRVEKGLKKILSSENSFPMVISHGEVHTAICLILGIKPYLTPNGSFTIFD